MALKALMLRKKIDDAKKALEALKTREADLEKREAELTQSIEEAETEEEQTAVDEAVEAFEADRTALANEKAGLETKISDLEGQLATEEARQDTTPHEEATATPAQERRDRTMRMMDGHENYVEREDVKAWLGEIRSCIGEKRALTNVGLTIPKVLLGLLRENIMNYSKLYRHVNVRRIGGEGRLIIQGTIPEAVWTDCCANINELDLSFAEQEVNCWKVGGFIPVCNAVLEDSDVDLTETILQALGQAIGRALDKAILYGTGSRMPLGIIPRLAQTSEPASYPATARAWADLHSTNLKTTSATGVALFQAIVTNFGDAKGAYSRGEKVWVMNEKTYTYLTAQAMSIDAGGAIVSGVNGVMPVVGGAIEVLDFVPDNNIIAGYFDLYLLAERAGEKFASSEHYRFLADQTVFKGTARYDGGPSIAEGFIGMAVNGGSVSTSQSFAPDTANSVQNIMLNTQAKTILKDATFQLVAFTAPGTGDVEWSSATTAKATVSSSGLVTGVASGSSVITATCNGLSASCTVTVVTE